MSGPRASPLMPGAREHCQRRDKSELHRHHQPARGEPAALEARFDLWLSCYSYPHGSRFECRDLTAAAMSEEGSPYSIIASHHGAVHRTGAMRHWRRPHPSRHEGPRGVRDWNRWARLGLNSRRPTMSMQDTTRRRTNPEARPAARVRSQVRQPRNPPGPSDGPRHPRKNPVPVSLSRG